MEFILGQELTVGALDTAGSTRLLIGISVQVVVMHVLRSRLTMARMNVRVIATVGHVVPAGLGLV